MFEVLVFAAISVIGLPTLVLLYLMYKKLSSFVYQLESLNNLVVSTTEDLDTIGFRDPETLDMKELTRRYLLRKRIITHFIHNDLQKAIEGGVGKALKRAFG